MARPSLLCRHSSLHRTLQQPAGLGCRQAREKSLLGVPVKATGLAALRDVKVLLVTVSVRDVDVAELADVDVLLVTVTLRGVDVAELAGVNVLLVTVPLADVVEAVVAVVEAAPRGAEATVGNHDGTQAATRAAPPSAMPLASE